MMKKLSHIDSHGQAAMVDVSGKQKTLRKAEAYCEVLVGRKILKLITSNEISKGDVIAAARIAGIQGAKKTSELIPLCHNISINKIDIKIIPDEKGSLIKIYCSAVTEDRTGIEMEAMTGAAIAGLTIYDMCKGADKSITLSEVKLLSKSGGKSGNYKRKSSSR